MENWAAQECVAVGVPEPVLGEQCRVMAKLVGNRLFADTCGGWRW
jgi:hypothetical protein